MAWAYEKSLNDPPSTADEIILEFLLVQGTGFGGQWLVPDSFC